MSALAMPRADAAFPLLHGSVERRGSLADFIWFRTGGPAEYLVRPKGAEDLAAMMRGLDPATPVLPIGVGSNLLVRDGGVPGVVVRLPKSLAKVAVDPGHRVRAGAGAFFRAAGPDVRESTLDARADGSIVINGVKVQ